MSDAMTHPPRVLHIGQRKTGTTWLQRATEGAAARGMLNYEYWRIEQMHLTRKLVDFAEADLAELAGYLPTDRSRPSLATQEGLMVVDAARLAEAVARVWPDARILITTRAPQGYLMSSLNNSSFGEGRSAADFARGFSRTHMPRVFDFDRKVRAYEAVFGPGSVHFLPYELLKRDAVAYLAQVSAILGTDLAPFAPKAAINVSPPPEYLLLQRRVNAMIAERAPEVLTSRDWMAFIRMANFSAGSATGLESYFADFFRNAPAMAGDLPQLSDAIATQLAEGMTVLCDQPLYRDLLPLYGLPPTSAPERS